MKSLKRWWPLAALALGVLTAHLLLTAAALQHLQSVAEAAREPARLEARYVSEVRLSRPAPARPAAAAPPPSRPPKPRRTRPAPEPAQTASPASAASAVAAADGAEAPSEASAALAAAAASEVASEPALAAASAPVPPMPLNGASAAVATAAAASAASTPTETDRPFGFDWPQATRIRYRLNGQFRGPIFGRAEVEWVRRGLQYQIHVDLDAGLFGRQIRSDGQITERGLAPQVFFEKYQAVGIRVRSRSIRFGGGEVTLAGGERLPAPPELQDEASQFVQLTFQFVRDPGLLQVGREVTLPMVRANSRRIEPYVYDVVGMDSIDTPLGRIAAAHLVPRRPPDRLGKGDWVLELWFSAQLEYLPVKLLFRKDDPLEEVYGELLIDRAPQRAVAPAAAAS